MRKYEQMNELEKRLVDNLGKGFHHLDYIFEVYVYVDPTMGYVFFEDDSIDVQEFFKNIMEFYRRVI